LEAGLRPKEKLRPPKFAEISRATAIRKRTENVGLLKGGGPLCRACSFVFLQKKKLPKIE